MCMCAVCVHIYTDSGFIFWEGEVGHPLSELTGKIHKIRNNFPVFQDHCPSHSHGLFFIMIATVRKSSISHRTEQFLLFQLLEWLIRWYVIIPWRAEAPCQNGPPQSPVPLKVIATELSESRGTTKIKQKTNKNKQKKNSFLEW